MQFADPKTRRWLWYAIETPDCVPLDSRAYPIVASYRGTVPQPEWVCSGIDGGLHLNTSFRRIDVAVAQSPGDEELSWICNYALFLIARSWLSELEDLVDSDRVHIGSVRRDGELLSGWSTIHEARPPALRATEERIQSCQLCGYSYTVLHGREFFSDKGVLGRPLIVNTNGLFVRQDVAEARNLRTPRGAFEPGVIEFQAIGNG